MTIYCGDHSLFVFLKFTHLFQTIKIILHYIPKKHNQQEGEWVRFEFPPTLLKNGNNVIAVEVHQVKKASSDMRFSMVLDYYKKGQKPRPLVPDG